MALLPKVDNAPPLYDGEILRCIVGSQLFGLSQSGTSDVDLMGICVEPPEQVIGLEGFEQHTFRTAPEGVRGGPTDIDLTVYSLRKFMRLAVKGNPTILTLFFVPPEFRLLDTPLAGNFRAMADKVIARSAAGQFLGYLNAQRDKMLGLRSAHTNRPELIEQFGYDCKFAAHSMRLGFQGVELMETGRLSLPMREPARQECMAVREGKWKLDDVVARVDEIAAKLATLRDTADLRPKADETAVNQFLIDTYQTHWRTGTH